MAPKVSSIKIKEVFKELQIIEVDSCPTAVFALVRILTDITIKQYLELKGYKFNEFGHLIITNGKEKNKVELKEKMNYIATNYLSGDLKASVVALNEDLLTQNLNQVMHNVVFCANTKQIRDFWKNLFPFVEFLWTEIIKLESNKSKYVLLAIKISRRKIDSQNLSQIFVLKIILMATTLSHMLVVLPLPYIYS